MRRYYDGETPLKKGSTPTDVYLECADNNEWNRSGSPKQLVFEDGAVRFKTELELADKVKPEAITRLKDELTMFIHSSYNEAEQRMLTSYLTSGSDNQKLEVGKVFNWINGDCLSELIAKKDDVVVATSIVELNAIHIETDLIQPPADLKSFLEIRELGL